MTSIFGVFWFHKDKFYGDEAPMGSNKVIAYGDYMQLNSDHFMIWDKYCRDMGYSSRVPYEAVPRGRILFHIPTHRYIVIGSKVIVNSEYVKKLLLTYYGLPLNTEFKGDEHYR